MEHLLPAIAAHSAKVVVIGQGYVGLPVAIRATQAGYHVVGFEASAEKVKALEAGQSYIEDIDDATLQAALDAGYLPTANPDHLGDFDIAVISVPTPLRDGLPDLTCIEAAGRALALHLRPGACVILESTTYPGTTTELLGPILCEGSGLEPGQFHLGYSPERIDPGNTTWTLTNTPKVVSGDTPDALKVVDAFFSTIVDHTVPVGTCAEAELVKLLENTFRHVNIALVNELAMFARELDVDIWRAIDAAATKPFGFMAFYPGPGVGGHCLPIDPSYLAWRVKRHVGRTFRFVELANDVNQLMPDYVHDRIVAMLNRDRLALNGSNILLLGWSYKRSTGDWRESPSVQVAKRLAASGAEVTICDPHVTDVNADAVPYPMVPFSESALAESDVVVILVDHPEFDANMIATYSGRTFDTRNLFDGRAFAGETL